MPHDLKEDIKKFSSRQLHSQIKVEKKKPRRWESVKASGWHDLYL
jgi:hypothetical protein